MLGEADLVAGLLPNELEPNGDLDTANQATSSFAAAPPNLYQLELSGTTGRGRPRLFQSRYAPQSGHMLTISLGVPPARLARHARRRPTAAYCGSAANPQLVKFDDDAGSGNDSLIYRLAITDTDNYFIQVTGYQNNLGTYELGCLLQTAGIAPLLGSDVHSEVEPNDTAAAATDASQSWHATMLQGTPPDRLRPAIAICMSTI